MKQIITVLFTILSLTTIADLRPYDYDIQLSSDRNTYARNEVIQFNVTFTSIASHTNGILLPGTKNKGKRLLNLAYYSVDSNDFYTNVFTESREIEMDTSTPGYIQWKNLRPGQSVTVPIFLNDTANYLTQNAAHHKLPNLPNGRYEVLAWYAPWDEPMAEHAFKLLNPFGRSDDDFASKRFYMHETQHSNYFSLTISDTPVFHSWAPTSACPKNCPLCEAVEISDWDKVKSQISKQTDYTNTLGMNFTDTNWLQPHRNVAWMYEGPEMILSSLPSYTYRSMIFRNKKGYFYYSATWQLGIIYPARSRLRYAISRVIRINPPLKSEELDYKKLVRFRLY